MIPFPDHTAAIPEWFAVGLLLGVALAVVAGILFALGDTLFPPPSNGTPGDGGESRRRAAIRAFLREIDETYIEAYSVHGVEVAFYLPERDVAITFDAPGYFQLTREGTPTVLVEHEMPIAHLKWRLPFETSEIGTTTGGMGDEGFERNGAFRILGLPSTATSEEVRAAYRERVKEAHPDHGGDHESFRRLRDAYMVAKQRAT